MPSTIHSARKPRVYESPRITVTYDPLRCTHVSECLRRLPAVFSTLRRPWVQPSQGEPDEIAEVILHCPTGALHYWRNDGGSEERSPAVSTLEIVEDGPLYLAGRLQLVASDGKTRLEDTRIALCRCGRSRNPPYCDNSHYLRSWFRDAGALGEGRSAVACAEPAAPAPLCLQLVKNGPVVATGPMRLRSADGGKVRLVSRCALCRCGASADKPFCDGQHQKIGFSTP